MQSLLPDDVPLDVTLFALGALKLSDIISQVASFYRMPVSAITDRSARGRGETGISFARHMVFYLARTMTRLSHQQIGIGAGGFDLSTVNYGHDRLAKLRERREIVRDDIDILRLRVIDAALKRCELSCH